MRVTLERPDPFDLPATVTSHGWYRLRPFEWDSSMRVLVHVDAYGDRVVRSTIRVTRTRIVIETNAEVPREELVSRVVRMLQFDLDLSDFYERCAKSSRLSEVPKHGRGRLLCAPTIFEDAVKIILTTNTRWSRTVTMNDRLVDHFGRGAGDVKAFPRPDDLANSSEEEIRELGRTGYRARSIHRLATELGDGTIDLSTRPDPASSDYEELHDWYLRLPGIGPYGAAHMTAMDGRHDRIAVDTEFRSWVRERYHGGREVKDSTMLRHYRQWGPWKYIAYWCEMMMDDAG